MEQKRSRTRNLAVSITIDFMLPRIYYKISKLAVARGSARYCEHDSATGNISLVAPKRGTQNAGSGTQLRTQTQNAKHVCNGIALERTKRILKTLSSL